MAVATSFWARLRGVHRTGPDVGVLMAVRTVHTFGMRRPLGIVALDADRRVVMTEQLTPGRIARHRRARWYLELPAHRALPPAGVVLELRPIVAS